MKGGISMIKSTKVTAKFVKKVAEKALRRDANSTTCTGIYQPKAPTNLERFKKLSK